MTWSPDGTRIAFTTKRNRDDKSQCYVLNMTGPGEARRVTEHENGVANPQWSPDGSMLAFESRVEAPDPAVEKEDEVSASAYETFPIRYWDRWLDDRQVHLFVQPIDDAEATRDLLAGTKLVAARGYSGSPGRGQDGLQARFSPDGKELVFVATIERDRSAHAPVRYHLWRVGIDGGEPRRVTTDDQASESGPRFSPTGDQLFWMRRPITEFVYNLPQLMARPWPDGDGAQRVAAGLDRPIDGFAVRGDRYWLLATEHGRRRLFGGAFADPAPPQLLDADSRGVYAGLAGATGGALVARWEDSTHPAEIVRIDADTGEHTLLTSFNVERAAELDRQPYQEYWFETDKGRRVHCWMALPPGFDRHQEVPADHLDARRPPQLVARHGSRALEPPPRRHARLRRDHAGLHRGPSATARRLRARSKATP